MKQENLFGDEFEIKDESAYTSKIVTPIYEPKNRKPHIMELIDRSKSIRLINEIKNSDLSEDEKKFLIYSAQRHNVFHYEKIADYYANSTSVMQKFMEKSALIIIDFDRAYELGYIQLAEELANQHLKQFGQE